MESSTPAPIGPEKQPRHGWKGFLPFVIPVLVVLVSVLILAGLYHAWPREYFPPTQGDPSPRLDEFMSAVMASRPAPGIAVGVVKGDALIFSRGYGLQRLEEGGSVGAETIFHTASVSKTFVALAVMQLVERGQVDLDAPVVRYLPYFRLSDVRSSQCTIRQLLSHTAGLPTDVEGGGWWESPEEDPGALERYVRSLENRSLVAGPGEKWHYSNMGYEVLGELIAKISGTTFEDYMRVHVLEPLGMASSTFLPLQGPSDRLAWPHRGSLMPAVSDVYRTRRAPRSSPTSRTWPAGWRRISIGAGLAARACFRRP